MSKKLQLQIPEPCHKSWDKMTPVDKGRFCDSCQKAVIDFTGMSDRQLVAFFKKPSTGSVCGRFHNDQLERDIAFPKKRIPWFKYMLQICLPVFIANTKAISQGEPQLKMDDATGTCTKLPGDAKELRFRLGGLRLESQPLRIELPQSKNRLYGKVINENGDPVPYASVVIKGTTKGVNSDADGYFNIKVDPKDKFVTLVTSSLGYETNEKSISNNVGSINEIVLKVEVKALDEVVVSSGIQGLIRCYSAGAVAVINGEILKVVKKDSVFTSIKNLFASYSLKVYPNPAKSGSAIKIEIKNNETAEMQIGLLNLQGQLISSSVINTYEKNSVITYQLPNMIAGSYFIRITNRKSGKIQTEKIIVQ